MNKKLFLLLTVGAIALFFACSGEVVESTYTSNGAELSLAVTVRDSLSGALLQADVSLNGGQPQQTKDGITVFGNVTTGTHTLLAKIKGYAEMTLPHTITPVYGQNAQIPKDYAATISLLPLTSGLWGYLRYTDENGVTRSVPAGKNVNLRLNGNNFINKLYTAKTDADGKYSFDSLPYVGNNYTLWVSETTIGNINYAITPIASKSLERVGSTYAGEIPLSNKTNLFVVSDYPSIIEYENITKPIQFKFTEPIDRSSIENSIVVSPSNLAVNIVWEKGDTVLTLTPMGNWKGLQSVNLELKSISGTYLKKPYPITVLLADLSASPAFVPELLNDNNKIDYNSEIYLKYKKIPGATEYYFYINNNNDGVYKIIDPASISQLVETEDSRIVSFTPSPGLFREVSILAQAGNDNSKTPLDITKAIKIKDKVPPTYDYATDGKYPNNDTLYRNVELTGFFGPIDVTVPDNLVPGGNLVTFSEPIQLDEVVVPSKLQNNVGGSESTNTRVHVERVWNGNNKEIKYKITIDGNPADLTAATNLNATLFITGIKDRSGNPFKVQYTKNSMGEPVLNGEKTVVAIRFFTAAP